MKIIINADDFGLDFDRDLGIFVGVIFGWITSVSVIVTNNITIFQKIMIIVMKKIKKISIGIHINLTDDPLLMCNSRSLYKNYFKSKKNKYIFWKNAISDEIYLKRIKKEILSQFSMFKTKFKFPPDHIDGHNHVNIFNRKINDIFEELAMTNKIHLRIPYENISNFNKENFRANPFFDDIDLELENKNKNFIINNYDKYIKYDMILNNIMCTINCNEDNIYYIGTIYGYYREYKILEEQIHKYSNCGTIQIMTHPGLYFKYIKHVTPFSNIDRNIELRVLKKLKKNSKKLNLKYVNYTNYNI